MNDQNQPSVNREATNSPHRQVYGTQMHSVMVQKMLDITLALACEQRFNWVLHH